MNRVELLFSMPETPNVAYCSFQKIIAIAPIPTLFGSVVLSLPHKKTRVYPLCTLESEQTLGLLLMIEYSQIDTVPVLRGTFNWPSSFHSFLLEVKHRRGSVTILRSPWCQKTKPCGEAHSRGETMWREGRRTRNPGGTDL